MFTSAILAASLLATAVSAHRPGAAHAAHAHSAKRSLPAHAWYHADNHPARALFARDATATSTLQPGTPAWVASFPSSTPDAKAMPQAWKDALNAAVAAGLIPNDAPSHLDGQGGQPTYATGVDPNSPNSVCSGTYKCKLPGQIWDSPEGVWGISFDDGPLPETSDKLYSFLQEKNQHATHFMIGVNIINAIPQFKMAYETLKDDIAVHTWTHPQMTGLTNEDVTAQLGWTIQAISDLTGGRLPRFWRPPTGDTDRRVDAIAKEVFGLTTVMWNQDTEDWSITTGGTTVDAVNKDLQTWFAGPKNPGLIILEHELSDESVGAFIANYPAGIAAGWKAVASTDPIITNTTVYRNAADNDAAVSSLAMVLSPSSSASSAASSSTTAAATGGAAHPNANEATGAGPGTSASATNAAAGNKAVATNSQAGSATQSSPSTSATPKNGATGFARPSALIASLALLTLPFLA
jgi:chitin deacetylase